MNPTKALGAVERAAASCGGSSEAVQMFHAKAKSTLAIPMVSAIIPTKNRPKYLARLLDSLYRQDYNNLEVIIVDDASDPPVSINHMASRVIRNKTRMGACFSRNVGCANSCGDLLFYLDDDTEILDDDCISRAVAWMALHSEVAAIGFAQLAPDGTLSPEQLVRTHSDHYVCKFWGYGCLIRKAAQDEVGGFNDLFGYYHEEEELSLKLHQAGYRIAFVPSLRVVHFRDPHNRRWITLYNLLCRNAIIKAVQHYPVWLLWPSVLRTLLHHAKLISQEKGMVWKETRVVLEEVMNIMPTVLARRRAMRTRVLLSFWRLKRQPIPIIAA